MIILSPANLIIPRSKVLIMSILVGQQMVELGCKAAGNYAAQFYQLA
jgi:hypothetical protein